MIVRPGTMLFLDAGILSLLAHSRGGDKARTARAWASDLIRGGVRVFIAEISDYEVRRGLIRVGATAGLRGLDGLRAALDFAPITTPAMFLAAQLWAESRNRRQATCDPNRIDADVILAAQALTAAGADRPVAVASPNARHLAQFLEVSDWTEIQISRPNLSLVPVPLPSA